MIAIRFQPLLRRFAGLLLAWFIAGDLRAADGPQPELLLSLRGVGDRTIEAGESLRVAVRVQVAREVPGHVRLAPVTGSWVDSLTVEIARTDSTAASVRAKPGGQPTARAATLDRARVAGGLWHFSSDDTRPLAPGHYVVRARLSIPQGSGWTGEVAAEAIELEVVAPSADPVRAAQRTLARAHDALAADKNEEAARHLDELLATAPENLRALLLRAAIAEKAGNHIGANLCLNLAFRILPPADRHPPPDLVELQGRVLRALVAEDGKPTPAPPPWSWPPPAVPEALQKRTATDPRTDRTTVKPKTDANGALIVDLTAPPPPRPAPSVSPAAKATVAPPAGTRPAVTPPPAPRPPSTAGFTGVWNTSFGPVTLKQEGSTVTGTYPRNGGTLQGTLDGAVLRFQWKQTNNSGRGIFRLAPDGNSFTGTFTYGATTDPEVSRNTWNGTRVN